MSLPVTIENGSLRVEVWPHFGGKILSVVDKADEYELLFDYPAEFPTNCHYDRPYGASYCAGWDECFPAIAPGPYPSHPYKGIAIPDHGELWSLPASASPIKDGLITEWNGLRFGYHFARKLWLEGPTLVLEYQVQNFAPFEFHFVWSTMALASVKAPVELRMPGGGYRISHDEQGRRIDQAFHWPTTDAGEDLSKPVELPPKRGWKSFSADPISAPAVVNYPTRKRSLTVEYASPDRLPAFWGVWISTGGWAGHRHYAIQPATGRFDELDLAVRENSAGKVPPLSRVGWSLRWTVGEAK